jgi:hypothetical protein
MDLNTIDLNTMNLNTIDLKKLPKFIEDNKHAKIYVTMEDGNQLCYDRVVGIYISRGNGLAITQISDGGQDLWEVSPGEMIDHLGKLVGVTYNLVIGRYEKFKKIEIFINDNVIQRHKYNDSFQCSNIMIN